MQTKRKTKIAELRKEVKLIIVFHGVRSPYYKGGKSEGKGDKKEIKSKPCHSGHPGYGGHYGEVATVQTF